MVLILITKETYNTCNFPGGGSGSPDPHLSMDSEIKRIGRIVDTPKYTVVQ